MRRLTLFFLTCLLFLSGCHNTKPTLHIFYSQTCANCQELENSLLKKLESEDINIIMHDIDKEESVQLYLETLNKLEDVDENLKEDLFVPFISLEGYFATVGYTSSMADIYMQLIHDALKNKDLTLPSGSWLYQKE